MEPDDLYPNEGTYFGGVPIEPRDQAATRNKEKGKVLAAQAEIKKVIKHLEARVAATDSVQEVLALAEKYQVPREDALVIMDIVRQQVEVEKQLLEEMLDAHGIK